MNLDFLQNNNVVDLFQLFKNDNKKLFIVGGAVRNALMDKKISDIDFCTTAKPESIKKILTKNNIKFDNIGEKFGMIKAFMKNETFEITTLRQDIYKKNRFPFVKFIKNIKKDAFRRDFTMNAIYLDFYGNIYDFYNGQNDIKNKIVKFIGNPQISISNDPLRILRYFRFCSEYFYENFDNESLNACLINFDKTFVINKKKFNIEYQKILSAKGAKIILDKWEKFGILEKINKYLE